jgi:ATP-binding cassette, subfamily B, bacterial
VGVVVQQVNKILAGTSTVGTLVALVSLIHLVFAPISTFSFAVATYKLERVAFDRFQQFLLLPEDAGLGKGSRLTVQKGAVEFRDVGFSYPGRLNSDQDGDGECSRELLAHFSLTIEGGSMVALVGPSGGGKTTLVRLLLALLKPQSGQVLIDGQDLARVDLETFYQQVAYIPQDAPIFDGSLRENITFGERVDDPHLREVIAQVGLDEWLSHLSAGLETIVGERGVKLSGGERQRLAFGRVLVQNPKIVILDEPTSALDSITEQVITENMREFMHGKTMLVIAHRLQTVKDAQRILVLEDGRIVQEGSFDALLCVDGRFRQLWEEQTREN